MQESRGNLKSMTKSTIILILSLIAISGSITGLDNWGEERLH